MADRRNGSLQDAAKSFFGETTCKRNKKIVEQHIFYAINTFEGENSKKEVNKKPKKCCIYKF